MVDPDLDPRVVALETELAEAKRLLGFSREGVAHWTNQAEQWMQRAERAEESLAFLRDHYTLFGGRMCPACLYEDGKFIKRCQLHEYISAIAGRSDEMEAILARVEQWTREPEATLKPLHASTYSEGMRDAKEQVARICASVDPTQ